MFWAGLAIGFIIGGSFGAIIMAMVTINIIKGKKDEEQE